MTVMPKDYYVVLGISRGANLNKIKRAYRKVVKEVHPDVTGSEEDAERFREVKEAYETLADEARRSAYDRELSREGSPLRVTRVPQRVERRRSFMDEMNRAFSTLVDDFFEGFVPGFYPPSQKTTGLAVDECANDVYATARCRPEAEADNRVQAEGEDGSSHGTTGFTRGAP
jgi:DnaJ-class molecular chaperone